MIHENIEKVKGRGQYFSLMAILGIAVLVCSVSPALAATSPTLGNAGSFAILGPETVTNTGPTVVIGDLGVFPGTAYTGFPPGTVIGGTHAGDATAGLAQIDNIAAFGVLDQICTTNYAGVQDLTLVSPLGPGVYCAQGFILTGNLELSGTGVWIFKSESTLITSPGSSVTGGDPCNVWWRVKSSATIETTTKFEGNILALTSISLKTGATLDGRALAQTGAVTMDSNKISPSVCGVSEALKLTKTASLVTYDHVGETITYEYKLKNTGTGDLTGPFTVSDDKVTVTCPPGLTLNPASSIICSASHNVIQADLDAGSITNNATATGRSVTSNQDQVTVTAVAQETKALTLNKTASPGTYDHVGQTITYSYELKNTGNVVLNGPFNVSDDKVTVTCPGTPNSLNPGSSIICSASYSVIQADLDAGSIINTANATAENNAVTSNQGQVTVTVTGQGSQIPEFPTVALPVIAVIGLLYMFQRRKGK